MSGVLEDKDESNLERKSAETPDKVRQDIAKYVSMDFPKIPFRGYFPLFVLFCNTAQSAVEMKRELRYRPPVDI